MGMSRADFLLLTPAEFEVALKAHHETSRSAQLGEWHRMRTLASILIRPHVKHAIPPSKLIPLPELDGKGGAQRRPPAKSVRREDDPELHARLTALSRAFARGGQ